MFWKDLWHRDKKVYDGYVYILWYKKSKYTDNLYLWQYYWATAEV